MELKNYVLTLTNGQGYPIVSKTHDATTLILRLKSMDVIEICRSGNSKFLFTDQLVEVFQTESNDHVMERSWTLAMEK